LEYTGINAELKCSDGGYHPIPRAGKWLLLTPVPEAPGGDIKIIIQAMWLARKKEVFV
jgi:hypothetical protein